MLIHPKSDGIATDRWHVTQHCEVIRCQQTVTGTTPVTHQVKKNGVRFSSQKWSRFFMYIFKKILRICRKGEKKTFLMSL